MATQTTTVTIPPSLPRLLSNWVVGNLFIFGGILGISVGLLGLPGSTLVMIAAAVVSLSTLFTAACAVMRTPRVVITSDGFTFHRLFDRRSYPWADVEGRFGIVKIGWTQFVGFNLTRDFKTRAGRKSTSLSSGYDNTMGGALAVSAPELAELLNKHKERGTEA